MRLVACKGCHTQYDVSNLVQEKIDCRCGAVLEVRDLESKDLAIHRCSSCGAHVAVGDDSCDYCGSAIVRDPRLLSLICPECCARNASDARFCGSCGVVFDPQPIAMETRELPCPVCSCLMPGRSIGGVGINECPKCHGIWCPEDRFDALLRRAIDAKQERRESDRGERGFDPRVKQGNPTALGVAYRKCPACDAFMQRRNFRKTSGVVIDCCKRHGTWLDADELEQIAGFLLSGGRPQAEAALRHAEARDRDEFQRARIANLNGGRDVPMYRETTSGDGWRTIAGLIESLLD